MANFLNGSASSIAATNSQAYSVASATRRKNAAYNALAATYGPAAGDPEAQAQLQTNDLNAALNPMKVEGAQLELDQAQRADKRTQGVAVLDAIRHQIGAGVAPGEALDNVAHYLPSLGVNEEVFAPLRAKLEAAPEETLSTLTQSLGTPSKVQGQSVYARGADGKLQIFNVDQQGKAVPLQLPQGVSPEAPVSGAGTVIQMPDGSYAMAKTDKLGNPVVAALPGAPVAAVQAERGLDIRQQTADAATTRAEKAGAGNGQVNGGVQSSVAAIDGQGRPGTIITYKDGTQQFTYPGGAPVQAEKQVAAATKVVEERQKRVTAIQGVLTRTQAVPEMTQQGTSLVDQMSPSPIIRKLSANIPGTAEYRFNELISQIKPNLSLQDLTAVRQQGLTLGQISVKEFEAAGNAYANLDLGQPQSTLRANLRRIESVFGRVNDNLAADVKRLSSEPAPASSPLDALKAAAPGAAVTSTKRTPDKNKAVGGVANSDHLTGQAADFTPRQGQSIAQLAQELRAAGVGEVVPEPKRNHVHVEWGPGAGRKAAPAPKLSDAALLSKYGVQ